MTRDELKELIRECLVEIITEGAATQLPMPPRAKIREAAVKAVAQDVPRRKTIGGMSLDRPALPQHAPPRQEQQRRPQTEAVARAASKITSDPVLASIFADTAATTMQAQSQAERMGTAAVADPFASVTAQREAHEMFGSAAQNWAALAFSDTTQR